MLLSPQSPNSAARARLKPVASPPQKIVACPPPNRPKCTVAVAAVLYRPAEVHRLYTYTYKRNFNNIFFC